MRRSDSSHSDDEFTGTDKHGDRYDSDDEFTGAHDGITG